MPSILVTPTKGLFQQAGTDALPSGSFSGYKNVTVASTADATLTAADSGKVYFTDGSTGHTLTLPSVAAGLHYKFIVKDSSNDVTIAAGSAIIVGEVAADGGSGISVAGSNIILEAAGIQGDFVVLECDGTNWYASGYTANSAGISAT